MYTVFTFPSKAIGVCSQMKTFAAIYINLILSEPFCKFIDKQIFKPECPHDLFACPEILRFELKDISVRVFLAPTKHPVW